MLKALISCQKNTYQHQELEVLGMETGYLVSIMALKLSTFGRFCRPCDLVELALRVRDHLV